MSDDGVGRAASWLPLVVGFERAARLPRRERPAHFRRQRAAWEAAADVLGEERYARIGERLARWRAPDPRLPLVKELLWALEQPEAAGYTRLALAGSTALLRLLPVDDVRSGYVLAQSARGVRTLGDLRGALVRCVLSGRLGRRHRDSWLSTRSATSSGTTYLYLGNYPAARDVFNDALAKQPSDPWLVATAHHGLLVSVIATKDWDAALAQGWRLLQERKSGGVARTDVLNLLGYLCCRIGRYRAAMRAAEEALRSAIRPDQVVSSLTVLVDVASATRDDVLGDRYGSVLRQHIGGPAGPFEDARALIVLARLENMRGRAAAAHADLARASMIADQLCYHEVQFEVEQLRVALTTKESEDGDDQKDEAPLQIDHQLSEPSRYILSKLDRWGEPAFDAEAVFR